MLGILNSLKYPGVPYHPSFWSLWPPFLMCVLLEGGTQASSTLSFEEWSVHSWIVSLLTPSLVLSPAWLRAMWTQLEETLGLCSAVPCFIFPKCSPFWLSPLNAELTCLPDSPSSSLFPWSSWNIDSCLLLALSSQIGRTCPLVTLIGFGLQIP